MSITANQRALILEWIGIANAKFGAAYVWQQAVRWFGSEKAAQVAMVNFLTGRGADSPSVAAPPPADAQPPPAGLPAPQPAGDPNGGGNGSAPVPADQPAGGAINGPLEPVNLSAAQWVGRAANARTLRPVVKLDGGEVMGGRVTFKCDRRGWPIKRGAKTLDGGICIFRQRPDGSWFGGFFDWVKVGQTTKDFANLRDGGEFDPPGTPKKGELVCFCVVSIDWSHRSTASQPVRWP